MNLTKASSSKTQNPTNEKQSELLPPSFFDQQAQPLGLDEIFTRSSQRDDITANNPTTKISFIRDRAILVTKRDSGSTKDGFAWKACTKAPLNQTNLKYEFKCETIGCSAKRRFKFSTDGQEKLVTTYMGSHSHPPPGETDRADRMSASCLVPESSIGLKQSSTTSYLGSSSSSVLPDQNFSSQLHPLPDEQLFSLPHQLYPLADQQLIHSPTQLYPLPEKLYLPHQKHFFHVPGMQELYPSSDGPNQEFFHVPEGPWF